MFRKVIFPVVLAVLYACNSAPREVKLSPETKLQLSAFESEWKAVGDNLKGWGDRLKINTDEIRSLDSLGLSLVNDRSSARLKMMADSLKTADEASKVRLGTLHDNYTLLLNKWSQEDSTYKAWKSELTTGKVKEEKVPETLSAYRQTLNKIKTDLGAWDKDLEAVRESSVGLSVRIQKATR